MFTSTWTWSELLLNTERMIEIAAVFLEGLDNGTSMDSPNYEHMAKISDRLEVSVDYLIRERTDSDALSWQEKELIEGFRKLPDEAQDVIIKNVKLLTAH